MSSQTLTENNAMAGDKKGKRQEYGVSAEQFCLVWEQSESAKEVAQKTGLDIGLVHARASTYRKMGIKLKQMKRVTKRSLNVEAINEMISREREHPTATTTEEPVNRVAGKMRRQKV